MDWARGRNSSRASTLFTPATEAMTPDLPKLRRKLQKLPRRVSWFGGESQESDKKRKKANRATSMSAAQSYVLPPALPEMGDSKWLDHVLQPLDSPRAQTWDVADLLPDPKKKPQAPVVPELSHLVVRKRVSNRRLGSSHSGSSARSRVSRGSRSPAASRRPGTPRTTNNSATIPARKPLPPSPTSSTETVGTSMRRHAKTPIFSIEQMERTNQIKAEAVAARRLERIASVEVIAEQYRALLDRSPSIYTQKSRKLLRPATPPPPMPERLDMGRRAVSEHVALQLRPKRPDTPLTPPGARSPTLSTKEPAKTAPESPKSRSFTLQSSHSKAPSFSGSSVSGSSSPTSVWSRRDSESGSDISVPSPTRASPAPGNLSLQICLDLLTRDLSSALTKNSRGDHDPCQRRPWRQESETSALQIWVMIEAYERLRDRLAAGEGAGAEMVPESKKAMEASLDMWLRSLYTIHDTLNGSHSPGASVRYSMSDYDEAEVRALD